MASSLPPPRRRTAAVWGAAWNCARRAEDRSRLPTSKVNKAGKPPPLSTQTPTMTTPAPTLPTTTGTMRHAAANDASAVIGATADAARRRVVSDERRRSARRLSRSRDSGVQLRCTEGPRRKEVKMSNSRAYLFARCHSQFTAQFQSVMTLKVTLSERLSVLLPSCAQPNRAVNMFRRSLPRLG